MTRKLKPIHPGEVLLEDYMKPLNLSQNGLAMHLRIPTTRIFEIVNGRRAITGETALRLSRYFRTTAQFWMNLQTSYDLGVAEDEKMTAIEREIKPATELIEA